MYAVSFMTFMIQESKALWESRGEHGEEPCDVSGRC